MCDISDVGQISTCYNFFPQVNTSDYKMNVVNVLNLYKQKYLVCKIFKCVVSRRCQLLRFYSAVVCYRRACYRTVCYRRACYRTMCYRRACYRTVCYRRACYRTVCYTCRRACYRTVCYRRACSFLPGNLCLDYNDIKLKRLEKLHRKLHDAIWMDVSTTDITAVRAVPRTAGHMAEDNLSLAASSTRNVISYCLFHKNILFSISMLQQSL
jgi:hypothetical protein